MPYKHVPKHAAIDALSSGPSSCKEFDRAKIIEQHRRRSAMAASSASMKTAPRLGSSLSVVSYPSPRATPAMSRSGSLNSVPTYPYARPYTNTAYANHSNGPKGKERELVPPLPYGFPSSMANPGTRAGKGTMPFKGIVEIVLLIMAIGYLHADTAENSSVSDDGLEMKRHQRHNTNGSPYLVESRPHALRQTTIRSENHHLHPAHQRRDARRSRGGERSDRNPAQVPRTRFTEPKPIDPSVLTMGLERDSSSTTLESANNGHSYASSSTSEAVPVSTAPSSLAPTPEPSTMVAYFPSSVDNHQDIPVKKRTADKAFTTSSSEGSTNRSAASVKLSSEGLKSLQPEMSQSGGNDQKTTHTALRELDPAKHAKSLPKTLGPVPSSNSKRHRWSWRRSNSGVENKLVASH